MTSQNESCEGWLSIWRSFKDLSGKDFLWCSSCNKPIPRDEVPEHVKAGHRVHVWIYIDPDFREEIVGALE